MKLSVSSIPFFVSAKTPRGLRRAMLRESGRRGAFIKWQDINQNSDGLWYAWSQAPLKDGDDLLSKKTLQQIAHEEGE